MSDGARQKTPGSEFDALYVLFPKNMYKMYQWVNKICIKSEIWIKIISQFVG